MKKEKKYQFTGEIKLHMHEEYGVFSVSAESEEAAAERLMEMVDETVSGTKFYASYDFNCLNPD